MSGASFKRYSSGVSGTELNIHYGDTAPEDASKLWIKGTQPDNIEFLQNITSENEVSGISLLGTKLSPIRTGVACATMGNKIYIFGGQQQVLSDTSTSSFVTYSTIQVYDASSNTIETLSAVLDSALGFVSCASVGTSIYIFGGQYSYKFASRYGGTENFYLAKAYDKIQIFDTKSNSITTLADETVGGYGAGMCCCAIGDKIYLFGGRDGGRASSSSYDIRYTQSSRIRVFDTNTNTIKTLSTTLPSALSFASCAAVDNKIYLFAGESSASKNIFVYDTILDTTETLTGISTTIGKYAGSLSMGSKIYLFAGQDKYDIQIFDSTALTIENSEELLKTGDSITVSPYGDEIYIVGTDDGRIQKFATRFILTNNHMLIEEGYQYNLFDIVKSPTRVQIGVRSAYIGDETGYAAKADAYLFDGTNWKNINTDISILVKLYPPTISISNDTLIITNDKRNGSNVTSYEIYKDGVLLTTLTNTSVDLSALITAAGTYAITAKAKGTNYEDSVLSNAVNYMAVNMTYQANQVASDTSLTTTVNCQVGDLVIAAIVVRSALTLPDGWTLVSTSNVITGDSNNQTLSFAYKVATSTSESITVTQATAGRIYTTLCALQGATSVTDIGYAYSAASTTVTSLAVTKTAGIKLWAASSPLWSTSAPYGDWSCSAETKYIAVDQASYQPRLGVFYEPDDELTSVTFIPQSTATYITVGGLNILY